jgi:glycosyltransferase involved in cell wall biosynthesis
MTLDEHILCSDDHPAVSKRPDIAIVLERFGSGGVERVACLLANGLARHGVRVEFIVLADEGPVRSILGPDIPVNVVAEASSGGRGLRLFRAVPAIARYLRRRRPRIILSPGNHTHVAAALAHQLAGARDVALVVKVTNPILKERYPRWRRWMKRHFYRRAFGRAALIFVLSRKGVQRMSAIDPALVPHTRFVHNPYLTAAIVKEPESPQLPDIPIILSAGRLSRQKNQAMLLEAAAMVTERPWHIRLVGTGPAEASLRERAIALGIADRVTFAGFVTDMGQEYRQAALLALPSRWEDLPATMVEALACGCPVVATACSEAVKTFLEEAGAMPPTAIGDVAAFARALASALDAGRAAVDPLLLHPYFIDSAVEEHLALLRPFLSRPA